MYSSGTIHVCIIEAVGNWDSEMRRNIWQLQAACDVVCREVGIRRGDSTRVGSIGDCRALIVPFCLLSRLLLLRRLLLLPILERQQHLVIYRFQRCRCVQTTYRWWFGFEHGDRNCPEWIIARYSSTNWPCEQQGKESGWQEGRHFPAQQPYLLCRM